MPSYLLVSLANLGPKMFNVTKINGVVSDVKSGKALANFTRRMYGDPLGPREQRSFRYPFVPSKKLSPGEYQMTFSVFYANRDKQPFSTVVYNEKNVLVRHSPRLPCPALPCPALPCPALPVRRGREARRTPHRARAPTHARCTNPRGARCQVAGPPEKSELPLTEIAMAVALVLGLAIAYTSLAPLLSGAPKTNAPVDTRSGASLAHWPIGCACTCWPLTPMHAHPTHPTHPPTHPSPRPPSLGSRGPVAMAARHRVAQEKEVPCHQAGLSGRWLCFAVRVASLNIRRRPPRAQKASRQKLVAFLVASWGL